MTRTDAGGVAHLRVTAGRDIRDDAFRAIVDGGWAIREMRMEGRSLEDVFVQIVTTETK